MGSTVDGEPERESAGCLCLVVGIAILALFLVQIMFLYSDFAQRGRARFIGSGRVEFILRKVTPGFERRRSTRLFGGRRYQGEPPSDSFVVVGPVAFWLRTPLGLFAAGIMLLPAWWLVRRFPKFSAACLMLPFLGYLLVIAAFRPVEDRIWLGEYGAMPREHGSPGPIVP